MNGHFTKNCRQNCRQNLNEKMNKKSRLDGTKTLKTEGTLVDRIIDYIQTEIAHDRLRANQKIRENQIAKELKISRSPIREALRALERDGLVKLIPGRGA